MLSACYYDKADKLYPVAVSCDTANMRYSTHVAPLITINCLNLGCHTSGNPSGGINLQSYANVMAVIPGDKLINALQYKTGGSKNMPPTGKLSACDVSKVDAWIKRGYPNN